MLSELDRTSRRIIGVLVEKELTTPLQYPLTTNAIINGSNQKNNRSPQMTLRDFEVDGALDSLYLEGWVDRESSSPGSRTMKWRHKASERMGIEGPDTAIMAELFLRGSQQPGELRSRVSRMADIGSMADLEERLAELKSKKLVREFPPRPGERARRWDHTFYAVGEFSGEPEHVAAPQEESSVPSETSHPAQTIAEVVARIARLEAEVESLKAVVRGRLEHSGDDVRESME